MISSAIFALGLGIAYVSARAASEQGLSRTALVLIGAWIACFSVVAFTGDYAPWPPFLCIDIIGAYYVLRQPAQRTEAIVGMVFLFQSSAHIAFAVVGDVAAIGVYLSILTLGGWIQIAAIIGGAVGGGISNRLVRGALDRSTKAANPPSAVSLEPHP